MDATHTIRSAVARVGELRAQAAVDADLKAALSAIKGFQAKRFVATYQDLLDSSEFGRAACFFLEELYGEGDYTLRDAQFARIAGALQKFFPNQVVATAVSLAQLHALTEELDFQMARSWMEVSTCTDTTDNAVRRYVDTWHTIGRADDRYLQLDSVLAVGAELDRLTRTPGLRFMLKMMHRPAVAAGLGSLQTFLETGFDTFAGMSGKGTRAKEFLSLIRERETLWMGHLFSSNRDACAKTLQEALK